MVRRAFTGGVMLATVSMIPLALMELVYALAIRSASLDSAAQTARFIFSLSLLLLAAGVILGLVEGMVSLGVGLLTKALARRRVAEPRWMAWLYSFLALPAIAMISARIFSGRSASQIPGKDLIALGLGITGLLAAYGTFRLIIATREQFRMRRWGPRHAQALSAALLLAAGLVYWADHAILPRLYGWFHLSLSVLLVALLQLAVGALYVGYRPRVRKLSRVMEPGVSGLVVVAGIAAGSSALLSINTSQALRFLTYEHTLISARLLHGASAAGLAGAKPRTIRPAAAKPSAKPPVAAAPDAAGKTPERVGPLVPDSSVLLITVDAMRADQLAAHGQRRKVVPNLDAWAAGGTIFERGYCQVPHTSFSIASLMTGTYLQPELQVAPGRRHRTLARALRRYGHKTAGFFPPAVFYIDKEHFTEHEKRRFGFEYVKYQYASAEKRVDQVLAFMRKHAGERVFVWAHFFEAHEPYEARKGFDFGARARDRYQSELAYIDHHLGRLLEHVKREMPRTIIALSADHGEAFGEHNSHYHGNNLYEAQVRVPLVLSVPEVKARRVLGPAQVIDLAPTILSLLDIPVPASMRGTDLSPWLAGEAAKVLPPAFMKLEQKSALVQGANKLICDFGGDFCELYDLEADPGERLNLANRKPDLVARLQLQLHRWQSSHLRTASASARGQSSDDGGDDEEALALLRRGGQGDVRTIAELTRLSEGHGELARRAVRVLARLRTPAARAALVRAGASRDPGVAIPACIGAATLGDPACLSKLPAHLDRADLPPALRLEALLAQARAGQRQATNELSQLLTSSADLYRRLQIISALGRLGDDVAAPALLAQLGELRTRLAAIKALGKIGAASAIPQLTRALTGDRFISWRRAAAVALGRIEDRRAVPVLQRAAARDLEPLVAADALAALGRIGAPPGPGARALRPGDWSCTGGECQLTVGPGDACAANAGKELMLALTPGLLRRRDQLQEFPTIKPAPTRAEAAPRAAMTVRCGQRQVSSLDLSRAGAEVVSLPEDAAGEMSLHTAGEPPQLGLAAVRKVPK